MKWLLIRLIRFYQKFLSPLKRNPCCRFTPTCSAYALEAFDQRGFFAGLALTLWRILRCSPLSPYGYDPVPQKGFKTMPMRWSKYDKYQAEQRAKGRATGADASQDTSSPTEDIPPSHGDT